ncbi:MAG: DUF1553 domain-containing protein [Verrucomicrobiales bacterium]|nr:DUF1553 domain-containing protein [Verrucomicrobiales bacterium]
MSRHCFACHGPDEKKREAKLRLDVREAAIEAGAIVPGDVEASELVYRLDCEDPDELMPPKGKGEPLTDTQKTLLRDWVKAGAPYEPHWAWVTPEAPAVPTVAAPADFPITGPIDAFVLSSMRAQGYEPAVPATREAWLRRVTIDLTGLPPSVEEIDAFLADTADGAHERVVDRLMDTVAHAERMAIEWLDVARYGDTYGRHEDFDCVVWPWRDWVIRAYQKNLPYDQFVILQTAGDLLPGARQEQIVATAFNRLNLQMNEAGSNEEEFRCENVADRVATNGHAFLGLTMECSRCHDHKYDPITMKDFYSMAGLLGNIDELGLYCRFTNAVPAPSIYVHSDENGKRHEDLKASIAAKEAEREAMRPAAEARFQEWLKANRPPMPGAGPGTWDRVMGWFSPPRKAHEMPVPTDAYDFNELKDKREFQNRMAPDRPGKMHKNIRQTDGPEGMGKALSFEDGRDNAAGLMGAGAFRRTDPFTLSAWVLLNGDLDEGAILHRTRSALEAAHRGYEITVEKNHIVFKLAHFWPGNAIAIRTVDPMPVKEWTHVVGTYDGSSRAGGLRLYLDGQPVETTVLRDNLYRDILYLQEWGDFDPEQVADAKVAENVELTVSGRINSKSFRNGAVDEISVYDRELSASEVALIHGKAGKPAESTWLDWYLREIDEPWREVSGQIRKLREEENTLTTEAVELMTMREMTPPRQAYVLERGLFNRRGEAVEPGTPSFLPPFPADQPRNRLGYAHWLTSRDNPLTARVAVNRIWQLFFGRGIVATAEDFGTQGELPSHPELIDWLAVHFQDRGWNIRELCREIVLSSTYRQSSLPRDAKTMETDPENRWLARGPRLRLTAEQLRDQVLAVSGLLNRQVGGPSVKPYQPAGLWEQGGTQHVYEQDTGDKLYRRSLYTFWRRTMPPANMAIFDAPSREYCEMRRSLTANPLQALVVLNDVQFVEAARVLAEELVQAHATPAGAGDAARVADACRRVLGVIPDAAVAGELAALIADARATYVADSASAKALLENSGETKPLAGLDPVEVAATTVMVRALFAYDGAMSKL